MYKFVLYVLVLPLCVFAIDSININRIFKKGKQRQARVFYIFFIFAMSYLVVNFISDFVGVMN